MTQGVLGRKAPDPLRAHGAWVYLVTSILAGVLAVLGRGELAALCAGLGFVGVYLVASALAVYPRPWRGRLALGLALGLGATGLGLALGGNPLWLVYASIAVGPAGASAWFAQRYGYLAPPALAFGVAALVVAAPAAACAGGADAHVGWLLLGMLGPFFAWRTWRTRTKLAGPGWTRARLRRLGLREAGIAVTWTALALVVVHLAAA